jgi:hypothetical protein
MYIDINNTIKKTNYAWNYNEWSSLNESLWNIYYLFLLGEMFLYVKTVFREINQFLFDPIRYLLHSSGFTVHYLRETEHQVSDKINMLISLMVEPVPSNIKA